MSQCEVCGNEYDKPLKIQTAHNIHIFDCFECAIHELAPQCFACGMRIIGHGVEDGEHIFCCAHCARKSGVTDIRDRTDRVPREVSGLSEKKVTRLRFDG